MPERQLILASAWAATLPGHVADEVVSTANTRTVVQGAEIFGQDEPFNGLYVLLSGQAHVLGLARDGTPLLMGILRPGDWTGFLAALDRRPYAFSAVAATETRVACLDPRAIDAIFGDSVAHHRLLAQPEFDASRQMIGFFIDRYGRPPLERVADRLLALARSPYVVEKGEPATLEHVSQDLLAAATRLSRQTVNTCLRELEQRELITLGYGRVEVRDADALRRCAAGN